MLKENFRNILDKNETYEFTNTILQKNGIKNYKRYIDNMFIERYFEWEMTCKDDCKEVVNDNDVVNDVKEGIFQCKCCLYPPCLNRISQGNYCSNHNKDMI